MADKGNTVISDGLSSYIYLDNPNNDYTHVKHIHSAGFGVGILSTSHIESIYMGAEKKKKNETYHSIPAHCRTGARMGPDSEYPHEGRPRYRI